MEKLVKILCSVIASTQITNAGESFFDHLSPFEADNQPILETPESVSDLPFGTLYKNDENPYVQQLNLIGRIHYQVGGTSIINDENGDDFYETVEEYRRARIGFTSKFLQYFDIKANINLVVDDRSGGGDLDFGYQNFDELLIGVDLKKLAGLDSFDKLHLNYGRRKFSISQEADSSSNSIDTVERTAISNKVFGSFRPAGAKLTGKRGPLDFIAAVYTTEIDNEFIAGWGDSAAFQTAAGYQLNDELYIHGDIVYNRGDIVDTWQYKWATSVYAKYDKDNWGAVADFIYGDNGDESDGQAVGEGGNFWGVSLTSHYWIQPKRLQAILRYQYQGSEEEAGIQLGSRYVRDLPETESAQISDGLGDQHHSIYAGLNYTLIENHARILAGVEYDNISTPNGQNVEAFTWAIAFRSFF